MALTPKILDYVSQKMGEVGCSLNRLLGYSDYFLVFSRFFDTSALGKVKSLIDRQNDKKIAKFNFSREDFSAF